MYESLNSANCTTVAVVITGTVVDDVSRRFLIAQEGRYEPNSPSPSDPPKSREPRVKGCHRGSNLSGLPDP